MKKILFRTLMTLLFVAVVTAGVYWVYVTFPSFMTFGGPGGLGMMEGGFEGRPEGGEGRALPGQMPEGFDPQATGGRMRPGGFEGREGGHNEISLARGMAGVLKNLGVIAIITLVVVGLQKLFSLIARRRRAQLGAV